MAAVVLRLRAEVRQRWLAWLGVALVAGIASGGIIGLLAGAVRTRDAYRDFSRTMRAADAIVAGRSAFGLAGAVDLDDVERLPQVQATARAGVSLVFTGRTGDGRRVGPVDLFPILPADDELGTVLERMDIREGRAADPHAVDEATASFVLAERLGLHPGSTIRLRFVRGSSFPTAAARLLSNFGARLAGAPGSSHSAIDELADGPDVTFRIVGIEASPAEFPPVGPDLAPPLHLTRAFTDRYGSQLVSSPLLFVRLRDPGQLDAFSKGIERLANGQPAGFVQSRSLQTPKVERAIRVQATAVRIVALLALLAVVLVVGQALLRQAFAEAGDDRVLRALGLERGELHLLVLARGLVVGVAAAIIAVVVAVLMSPLMPVGLARVAELHHGIDVDPLILGLGALAVVVGIVALRALAAWRVNVAQSATASAGHPSRATRVLEHSRLSPSADIGVRFALDAGRGETSTGVWTTVLGATLTIALLAGLWSFQVSLQHMLDSPRLYGWNWSVKSGAPALPDISTALVPAFSHDPVVSAFAAGTVTQAELGLERVDVMGMQQEQGRVAPTVVEGRLPRRANEVMLGARNLERAGLELGDIAVLRLGNTAAGLRIVGRGLFPEFGDAGGLGNGVYMTYRGLQRMLPEARRNVFLIRYRTGTDPAAETVHLRQALDPLPTRSSGEPRELQALSDVSGLPALLGGLLVLLAVATLAHTLISSVRRRRRELAVLRTMGFVRRQVWLSVFWQTTTLVAIALVVGIPFGALLGRLAWNVFAEDLGAIPDAQVAWVPFLLTIPAALLLASIVAAVPAWLAGRMRPSVALRAE
jgi:ABC-type lipoprotein release transport system permease subunit